MAFYARSGQQAISAIMAFDPKLIPLFDGTDAGQSVVEWVETAELVCRLSGVKHISGGAYAVYQQLSEEKRADFACIKDILYTAFALSPVTASRGLPWGLPEVVGMAQQAHCS